MLLFLTASECSNESGIQTILHSSQSIGMHIFLCGSDNRSYSHHNHFAVDFINIKPPKEINGEKPLTTLVLGS